MKSFEIHFSKTGKVLIDNIKGVNPESSECLDVTKPYLDDLGIVVNMQMLNENLNNTTIEETS